MIHKFSLVSLSILALANIIVLVITWGQLAYFGLQDYRSPIRGVNLSSQETMPAHTSKLVIVLISGLGYESAEEIELPTLEQLKQAGASRQIESKHPTYSQTAWGTIVTGATAEINDAPPIDKPVSTLHAIQTDTIFNRASATGLRTALLGSRIWHGLIPPAQVDYPFFIDGLDAEADETIIEAALPIIEHDDIELILVQFSQLESAALSDGLTSEAYLEAARRIDTYLAQISQAMDLSSSVLMIISDHGHLENGGYGGTEPEISYQPLVMVGQNIVPGEYSDARQLDIAPTVTTLLGLAPPTAAQGRILFELLRFSNEDRALAQLRLAQQRVELVETYVSIVNETYTPVSTVLINDLERAEAIFAEQNINGTYELASLVQKQADTEIELARNNRLGQEQLMRLIGIIMLVIVWTTLMWRFRGPYTSIIIIAAIITVALYHGLYQLQGYSYSISSFPNLAELPLGIARRTTVSMLIGGGILMILLLLSDEGDWITLLGIGYGFGLLVTFIFALPLFWAFWQNGTAPVWFLPEALPAFWQVSGTFEVMVVAIIGFLLPWPIMSLNVFVSLVRRRLYETGSKTTIPGLRF
jgi:hypothetical protein